MKKRCKVVRNAVRAGAAGVFLGNVFRAEDMCLFLRQARAVLDGAALL
jgi:hypothetical protein